MRKKQVLQHKYEFIFEGGRPLASFIESKGLLEVNSIETGYAEKIKGEGSRKTIEDFPDGYIKKALNELPKLFKKVIPTNRDKILLMFRIYNPNSIPIHKLLLPKYSAKIEKKYKQQDTYSYKDICKRIDECLLYALRSVTAETFMFYIDKDLYINLIKKIRNLTGKLEKKKELSKKDIEVLNKIKKELPIQDNPVTNFLNSLYKSLTNEAITKKVIAQCGFCGLFFKYKIGKKYCSLKFEGRDCGKKARNRIYYEAHKSELRNHYRKKMKDTRIFLKEKGIKK